MTDLALYITHKKQFLMLASRPVSDACIGGSIRQGVRGGACRPGCPTGVGRRGEMISRPFVDMRVEHCFTNYAPDVLPAMLDLRELIFEVAKNDSRIGRLTETIRWGQPSYITKETGAGSTIRIDAVSEDEVAVYFICTSGLVEEFRRPYEDVLKFKGNRAILLNVRDALPVRALEHCVGLALTHHLRKRRRG